MKQKLVSILIVEDEEDHARIIKRGLKETVHLINEVYWVENGVDAIDFLTHSGKFEGTNTTHPGLVLLDIKLPLKDGFEVLTEIKQREELKQIPVVMLTTTSTSEDIQRAMLLGANDYIVKPVKFNDFIEKISKLGYYWGFVSDANGA